MQKKHTRFVGKKVLTLVMVLLLVVSSLGIISFADDYYCEHTVTDVRIEEIKPTCTEPGSYNEITYCVDCGAELDWQSVPIQAAGHVPGEAVRENEILATCTTPGSHDEVVYCTACGAELSREIYSDPFADHTPGDPVRENEVAPTCSEQGSYDKVVYCISCGSELSRERVTSSDPLADHTWDEGVVTTKPTKYADGIMTYTCEVCGTTITEEIPMLMTATVVFANAAPDAKIEVYPAPTADDPNPEAIPVEEDGYWLLTDGDYEYTAEADKYARIEETPFQVTVFEPGTTMVIELQMKLVEGAYGKVDQNQGKNLEWKLDEEGKLTITGKGEMENYKPGSPKPGFELEYELDTRQIAPWEDIREDIKTIEIQEEVTSIGDYAFYGCSNLESVKLPQSLTSIGEYAFDECEELKTGTIEYAGSNLQWEEIQVKEDNPELEQIQIQFAFFEEPVQGTDVSTATGYVGAEETNEMTAVNESNSQAAVQVTDGEDGPALDEKITDADVPVSMPPFEPDPVKVGQVVITVSAPEGVFPEGATLHVKKVSSRKEAEVDEAVEAIRDENVNVAASYTFDITVKDDKGNEIQPTDGSKVQVAFALDEVAEENLDTAVYHVSKDEETQELVAEELPVVEEIITGQDSDKPAVVVETDGFSYYQVEFTYESKQYVLQGGESRPLSEILQEVHLTGTVEDVEVSNRDLFSVGEENGVQMVYSHQPFDTTEWMKVTIGGQIYEITVTDAKTIVHHHTTEDGTTTIDFNPWTSTNSLPTESGNYYLTVDVNLGATWTVPDGETRLCLNGHNIECTADKDVIEIGANSTLTLYDEHTDEQAGKITHQEDKTGNGISVKGKLIMNGGQINNNSGCGVYIVEPLASFTLNGGRISNNRSSGVLDSGTFVMTGGEITNNSRIGHGGGVFVYNGNTFTMSGGSITGNSAQIGGGVCLARAGNATLNISGNAIISGNTSNNGPSNVCLSQYKNDSVELSESIDILGLLQDTAKIGVTIIDGNGNPIPGVFTSGLSENGNVTHFTSDDSDYGVTLTKDGEAQLVMLRTIRIDNAENGTITVKNGDKVISNGDKAPEGTELTVSAVANKGYYLKEGPVAQKTSDGQTTVKVVDGKFTVPGYDTTVTATFEKQTPEATPEAEFTATGSESGTLTNVASGMKYSVDGGNNWVDITATSVTIASGVTVTNGIKVYKPGNGISTTNSDVQTISVTKAETPNLTVTQPATVGGNGSVATKEEHEYSSDNGTTWIPCETDQSFDPGTYLIRVKANGSILASDAQIVVIHQLISFTVTFKVVNGSWNDGDRKDKKITLSRYVDEDLVLVLTKEDFPAVGSKPDDGYTSGKWDHEPPVETAVSDSLTFTYTYLEKGKISATVHFKVVNGSWDDGTKTEKTVTLTGYEGDTLKLSTDQIPAVGKKPDDSYKAGSWDVAPDTTKAIDKDTTYTYTYSKIPIQYTVTEGAGSEYKIGSDGTLTFVFKRSENDEDTFKHFTGLKYDGQSLTRDKHYTAKSGSVIIELQNSFLKGLKAGDHTLTATFDDGAPADAAFKVLEVTTYKVTFNANGHGAAPAAQSVIAGEKAKEPAKLTADGFTFGGWYKEKECQNAFSFDTPITGDITLYAKWMAASSSGSGTNTSGSAANTQGGASGSSANRSTPGTGDTNNTLLWILLLVTSLLAIGVVVFVVVRKKQMK